MFGGGYNDSTVIDYVTITTRGDATDFGDLTQGRESPGCVSSGSRGVWGGGYLNGSSTRTNVMDYVTIASPGNATDFGDLPLAVSVHAGTSNGHGGL